MFASSEYTKTSLTSLRRPSEELLPSVVEAELAGVLLGHDDLPLFDRVVDLVLSRCRKVTC